MWCVPKLDKEYIEKMEDVLEVYARPLDPQEPVVCLDEKPVQLLEDARPLQRATTPGTITKRDSEYVRHGTANIFGVVEPKAGRHLSCVTPDRSGAEFAKMMAGVARCYPEAETIHLVMDNLNTHREASLIQFYGEEIGRSIWDRFTVHYTPKHGSWLNQAEIELSLVSRQALGKERVPDRALLQKQVTIWSRCATRRKSIINWTFTKRKAQLHFGYKPENRRSEH
jgi:hypothetical protein